MSWWTDLRDSVEKAATLGFYDPKAARQAEAQQRYMINDQIKAYKAQTELSRQQLDQARTATENEKRRVEQKQIRALRRNYRAAGAGMLGVGAPANNDMNTQLGG